MNFRRIACTALALMLLATGAKTRPVEYAQDRFERQKPAAVNALTARA